VQPAITLPQGYTNLQISPDGLVTVTLPAGTQSQVGQLQLADFINPDGLQPIGGNLYLATTSSGAETLANPSSSGYGDLYQNMLEGSNVNVVEEMVNLIEAQRAFEVTSKAVSSVDTMMEDLNHTT
jgi:flagellar basal-body rod protein FlgG